MRRGLRVAYFLGLTVTLFGGTLALVVLATRLWHPGPDATQLARLAFGIVFIALGLGGWAGLAHLYRRLVPLPCRHCGRPVYAVSLNPVQIRCPQCGESETLRFRVHGAS